MTTKTLVPNGTIRCVAMPAMPWLTNPSTLEGRVRHMEAIGQHIQAMVGYMCQVGTLAGTSAEAKDRAVTAFHERLVQMESELARIQEGLQLG